MGRLVGGGAGLLVPLFRRVVTLFFIQPVAVEHGKVDLVLDICQHLVVGGQTWAQTLQWVLVVSAGEFEAEVEVAVWVEVGIFELSGVRQCPK